MIERAVARQVRPLREELMAAQDQARLHDILGGIGYILGLTGIALWWRARRSPTAS
jgi:nickel transport protein